MNSLRISLCANLALLGLLGYVALQTEQVPNREQTLEIESATFIPLNADGQSANHYEKSHFGPSRATDRIPATILLAESLPGLPRPIEQGSSGVNLAYFEFNYKYLREYQTNLHQRLIQQMTTEQDTARLFEFAALFMAENSHGQLPAQAVSKLLTHGQSLPDVIQLVMLEMLMNQYQPMNTELLVPYLSSPSSEIRQQAQAAIDKIGNV